MQPFKEPARTASLPAPKENIPPKLKTKNAELSAASNSICIYLERDGKSLIIKPIAFSRWSKKSTFKKLPRGL